MYLKNSPTVPWRQCVWWTAVVKYVFRNYLGKQIHRIMSRREKRRAIYVWLCSSVNDTEVWVRGHAHTHANGPGQRSQLTCEETRSPILSWTVIDSVQKFLIPHLDNANLHIFLCIFIIFPPRLCPSWSFCCQQYGRCRCSHHPPCLHPLCCDIVVTCKLYF